MTATLVGAVALRETRGALVDDQLDRLSDKARTLSSILENYVNGTATDVQGLLGTPAIGAIFQAMDAGEAGQADLALWKARLAETFLSQMAANPNYLQLRLIGAEDRGRELVRIDRLKAGGNLRVVPDSELQSKASRSYYQETIRLAAGGLHISPVNLNREHGEIQLPLTPVVRAAVPMYDDRGKPRGILIVNMDMRPVLARLRDAALDGEVVYLVNPDGEYLLHPSLERTFRFDYGKSSLWTTDFPELPRLDAAAKPNAQGTRDTAGHDIVVARAGATLQNGAILTVMVSVPHAKFLQPVAAIENTVLAGAAGVAILALLLALFLAHSLTRPLNAMTAAIEGFGRGEHVTLPTTATGEIGLLAKTFKHYAEKERLYGAAVEFSDDAIWTMTLHGIINSVNQAATNLYGYTADELVGEPMSRLTPEDVREDLAEILDHMQHGERIAGFETVHRRKNGEHIHVALTISPIFSPAGKPIGAATFARDITEQRHMREQLHQAQKMEALGQLTGGIAHDFNNLLSIVIGNGSLLAKQLKERKQHAMLERITSAAEHGVQLTRSLLAFGRRQPLEIRAVDVNHHVANIQNLASHTLGRQIEIVTELDPRLPQVRADPTQLESAMLNLLVNARDAMNGTGRIAIETKSLQIDDDAADTAFDNVAPGTYVLIAVSDSGHGIPEDTLKRVFEPFFTTKGEDKGTGLGLSMVFGLMHQLGGEALIESEIDVGTTVKLYLPVATSERGQETDVEPDAAETGDKERILVVEDDEALRTSTCEQLEMLGYRVVVASNGGEALALIEDGNAFDLLFADLIMPGGMTGVELADRAIALRPDLKVLFTTGYIDEATEQTKLPGHNAKVLAKPFGLKDLQQHVEQALGNETYAPA